MVTEDIDYILADILGVGVSDIRLILGRLPIVFANQGKVRLRQ